MSAIKDQKFQSILSAIEKRSGFPATKHQIDIYRSIHQHPTESGNLLVQAVAGSGKSTTIRNALGFLPEYSKNMIVAFNTHIAKAMQEKGLPAHTQAGTLHSVCFRAYTRTLPQGVRVNMNQWKTRDILRNIIPTYGNRWEEELRDLESIVEAVTNADDWDSARREADLCQMKLNALGECETYIAKLIGLLKSQSAGDANEENIMYLVDRNGIDWHPSWTDIASEAYEIGLGQTTLLDFDDQLLYSLNESCKFDRFDNIFVDESQDLNPIQIDILAKMSRLGSKDAARVIFVGDSRQSIYGFRGADPQAIREIETRFATKCLPLSVSWRCGRKIIEAAQTVVPQIEAAPNAPEGEIIRLRERDFPATVQSGDYVLCRITSPLVSWCLKLLSKGRKAVVLGRDIGKTLNSILKKFNSPEYDNQELMGKVTYWQQLETGRIPGKDIRSKLKISMIVDKAEALRAICLGCETVAEAQAKIEQIFSDQSGGVTFSTIHKAKGLEADRIFIIRPDLIPFPHAKLEWEQEQEINLIYVATTRAKLKLFYVDKENCGGGVLRDLITEPDQQLIEQERI